MHDVAARAGVSHQTVSRVINGSGPVRPATRDRIALAIGQLGYHGNLAARMLATRRSRAIGVLAPEVTDFGPTSTIHALEFAARARGYRLIVVTCLDEAHSIEESLSMLVQQSVEAIVVVAPSATTAVATSTLIGLPILPLQRVDDPEMPAAFVDQAAGVALAMRHLIGLGHRRIQMLLGPSHYIEALQRRAAYEMATRSAGLSPGMFIAGDWTARSGYGAANSVDASTTAVLCANDQMALGLIAGLRSRTLRVPDDVSVIGFDDVPEAAYFSPPLTTVRQDFARLGEVAIDQLDRLLTGGTATAHAIIPELMLRNSTRRVG
ncbi:LacI family DNA-binding transcriptional regulator [soil metagenome]